MYVSQSVKKKGTELYSSVSIYKGQKTLKNRYRRLGFESGRIILQKGRKWCVLSSLKGHWAKAHMMEIQHCKCAIRHSKIAELAFGGRTHFHVWVPFDFSF